MKAFRYGIAAGPADAAAAAPSAPADVPDLAAEPDPASDLAAEPDLAHAATGLPARLPKARRGAVAPRTGLQGDFNDLHPHKEGRSALCLAAAIQILGTFP